MHVTITFSLKQGKPEQAVDPFGYLFKGALDKYNIIPNFFPQKLGFFYTIRSVGMGNDLMTLC